MNALSFLLILYIGSLAFYISEAQTTAEKTCTALSACGDCTKVATCQYCENETLKIGTCVLATAQCPANTVKIAVCPAAPTYPTCDLCLKQTGHEWCQSKQTDVLGGVCLTTADSTAKCGQVVAGEVETSVVKVATGCPKVGMATTKSGLSLVAAIAAVWVAAASS